MPRSVYSAVGRGGPSRFNPKNLGKRFAVSVLAASLGLLGVATAASAAAVSAVSFTPQTTAAGTPTQWTVTFTPTNSVASSGTVTATFPAGFVMPTGTPIVAATSGAGTCSAPTGSVSGQSIVISLVSTCALTGGTAATFTIGGVTGTGTLVNSISAPAGTYAGSAFTVATSVDSAFAAASGVTILPTTYLGATAVQGGLNSASTPTATAHINFKADGIDSTYTVTGQNWTTGTGQALEAGVSIGSPVTTSPAAGTAETINVTGLTVGDDYKFTVTPTGAGTSGFAASTTALFSPTTALGAPTVQNAGSGAVAVTFSTDGVATLYTVNTLNVSSGSAVAAPNTCAYASATPTNAATSETCVVTGLTNGGQYEFTVTPSGNNTTSTVSAASASITVGAAIGTPKVVAAGSDNSGTGTVQVVVSWTADGVATQYVVASSPGNFTCTVANTTTAPTGTQSCTVTGLTSGTAYTFTVTPSGNNTSSTVSLASSPISPTDAIGAPTVTAGGVGAAKVTFATDGVATSYTVNAFSNGGSGSTFTTTTIFSCVVANTTTPPAGMQSCTVTGLHAGSSAGLEYEFTVTPTGGNTASTVSALSTPFYVTNALATPTAAIAGPTSVTVTFTADGIDSLYTVNAYLAGSLSTIKGSCVVANTTTPPTGSQSCTVTGLTAGATYVFQVVPANPIPSSATGSTTSAYSAAVTLGTPISITNVVPNGTGAITVTFTADGVATKYVVNSYVGSSATATSQSCTIVNATTPPSGSQSCTVTGLTNGTGYTFTVTPSGNGTSSTISAQTTSAVAPGSALATPTAATAGSQAIAVTFTADGVATVYTVSTHDVTTAANVSNSCTVANTATPPTGSQSCTVTGLVNGDSYTFTVTPTGNGTVSSTSPASAAVTASSALATPTVANAGSGAVLVTFTADGTASTYTVTAYNGATASNTCVVANTTTAPTGTQSCTVTGLTNGATYTFVVTPSGNGTTSTSSTSKAILVGVNFLAAPVATYGGTGAALVTFTADGVASTYTVASTAVVVPSGVTAANGTCVVINSTTAPTGTQSCTVTGLTNGVTYTFTVTPTGNGTTSLTSKASAPFTVSAAIAPSTPTAVTATATANSVTVNWTAAVSNGSALTGYVVTATAGNTTTSCGTVAGIATSCTISGLSPATVYVISVAAVNAVGTSVAATASATTLAAPAAKNPFTSGTHGIAYVGRTVTLTISGGNFYGQPRITSNNAGTRVGVKGDTGTLLTIIVTTSASGRKGWHTFTITLANGKVCRANYLVK